MNYTIALFGEAERGRYKTAYHCQDLAALACHLGEPPDRDSLGLQLAIQTLLYNCSVIFFRVEEEGFSQEDYFFGLNFLKNREKFPQIAAVGIPGVGDFSIIEATTLVCMLHNSLLIITEKDLYDFLTNT